MSNVKERLLGAITVMDETTAARLWDFVLNITDSRWEAIEEVKPDEIDLKMIQEIQSDPDCKTFD